MKGHEGSWRKNGNEQVSTGRITLGLFALQSTRAALIRSSGQDANFKSAEGQDGLILTWVSVTAARPLPPPQRRQVWLFGCCKT